MYVVARISASNYKSHYTLQDFYLACLITRILQFSTPVVTVGISRDHISYIFRNLVPAMFLINFVCL